jgi:hypothetical protein
MAKILRITRNVEANELVNHIRGDNVMMTALKTALREFWQQYKAGFSVAGRSTSDPSPMLIPPTTDLIIALIECKVETLKAAPQFTRAATELDALLKKASLYPVADDILQICLPDYRSMAEIGQFEVIDESTRAKKPWWQFW